MSNPDTPTTEDPAIYTITDDDGFLALLDPDAYNPHVTPDAPAREYTSIAELEDVLRREAQRQTCLVWGTRWEDEWRVCVTQQPSPLQGFRERTDYITASEGRLCLTDSGTVHYAPNIVYEPLFWQEQDVYLTPGPYQCRIVQMDDPYSDDRHSDFDFLIELTLLQIVPTHQITWEKIPWIEPYI